MERWNGAIGAALIAVAATLSAAVIQVIGTSDGGDQEGKGDSPGGTTVLTVR